MKRPKLPMFWKLPVKIKPYYTNRYMAVDSDNMPIATDLTLSEAKALVYAVNKVYGKRR